MSFRTELKIPKSNHLIEYDSNILMIGSCFSVEIGNKLSQLKYNVLQNPSGITFNPFSILTIIRACTLGVSLPKDDFFLRNDLWRHSDFHGSYNHPDNETCIINAQDSIDKAHTFISSISNVVITLGTAYVYKEKSSGHIVNNCHKRPSQDFSKRILTIDEIVQYLEESIQLLVEASEHKIQFILTISPVRHIKDGIIENQRSKARLIEATHRLQEKFEEVSYFPAYELLLDDLRDYRFYDRDLVHPSDEAVDYIYDKFQNAYLSDSDRELRKQITQISNSLNHRPLFVNTDEHKSFVNQLIIRLEKIMSDYPHISYDADIEKLRNVHLK